MAEWKEHDDGTHWLYITEGVVANITSAENAGWLVVFQSGCLTTMSTWPLLRQAKMYSESKGVSELYNRIERDTAALKELEGLG